MRFEKLFRNVRRREKIDDILARSTKAVCGAFEREIIVPASKVASTKTLLKQKGYIIIGTGPAGPNSKKIWFNPAGVNL